MKRKYNLLILCISIVTLLQAQQTNTAVIAPAGTSTNGTAVMLDWTLGELAVQSLETSNRLFTEGFHQPVLIVKETTEEEDTPILFNGQIDVWVGPNPTVSILYIKIDTDLEGQAVLSLRTIEGKLLKNERISLSSTDHEWDMSQYPGGLYILAIHTEKGEMLRTFKITKAY